MRSSNYKGKSSSYEGEFLGGKPHGTGEQKMRNGSVFHGEFFNGKKEGKGILRL